MSRRTKAEMEAFRSVLRRIVEENRPCSVRQVYYVGLGEFWDKDRGGVRTVYNDISRNLGIMRERGDLPWGWLIDSTRYVRQDTMYESVQDAMERMHEQYRRNLWGHQPVRVEVWGESDSTCNLIDDVVRATGVGLYSCRGQAGKEFVYGAAEAYLRIGKPVRILYLGDWDPSGLAIRRSLEERLHRYSHGEIDIDFQSIAITPDQIRLGDLKRHDVNTKDSSYRRFVAECALVGLAEQDAVEVEAISPPALRQLVHDVIYDAIPDAEAWNREVELEEHDRAQLGEAIDQGWWSS